ncbi:MAG: ATP-binding protein [Acidimicrobiia bacterium]|nr:ATP-binding protein [Acidimicrobiia bacterium]MYF84099.1 ATP-binding protein [Acidimicrobiia bacterium]
MANHTVGRVLGTDDATPLEFWVAVANGQHLQLDDIVALDRSLPTGEVVSIYGIVGQVRARHEGARFDSDVFLIADGVLPADVAEAAQIQVTRVVPETFVPPLPGAEVRRAVDEERDEALDMTDVEHRLPAGLTRDGQPVVLDLEFIDGTKGAHVNISGISGVATKTSYATFLLYSLFNSGVLGAAATNTKGLIFNVKGEDLLFLDHANTRLDDTERARYAALGLEAGPFRSMRVLAPPRKGDPNATPATGARTADVKPLYWTVAQFCEQGLLPFLFADAEDERQQYTIVVQSVTAQLQRCAMQSHTSDGAVRIDGRTARTFSQLVTIICDKLLPDDPDEDADPQWTGRSIYTGTINAFVRRLSSAERHVAHLIRADIDDAETHAIDLDSQQVTVVDLHMLHDRAKRFVVGVVLRQAFEAKEAAGTAEPLQFVVLDELNKYAPRDSSSPIKEILLDVAERGRSLGMILIGAQQTASEVERRVVSNSAIRVVGRLDAAEAGREQYGFLPAVQRQRATILKPGSMFVSQPRLPVPVLLEFPFPAWATRVAEADLSGGRSDQPADPFDGLT